MTHKSMRKVMAAILSAAMLFQMGTAPATQAAAKVKLAKKTIVLTEKKSKTVKVTGVKKAKIKKVKWSISSKKVATVKAKGKTAVKVTAKKAGNAKVTGKFTLKGVKKIQRVTLKVQVKAASGAEDKDEKDTPDTPAQTTSASQKPGTAPTQKPQVTPTRKPEATPSQKPETTPAQTADPATSPSTSPAATTAPSSDPTVTETPAASQAPDEFQPVLFKNATFETGTDGFVSRGSSKVSQADNGYDGKCLYVTGRTDTWNGAALDVTSTIVPGAKYRVTAYMKQMSGDTTSIKCSVQMGQSYPEIATVEAAPSGEWVKIEGEIEVATSFSEYLIYFEMPKSETADFYLDSVVITQISKGKEVIDPDSLDSIKDTYKDIFQYMGTCANYYGYGAKKDQLTTPKLVNFIKKQFNSITLENEMKPDAVLGNKNLITVEQAKNLGYYIPDNYPETKVPKLNLDTVDATLKFCADNNVKMRAHTLMWHQQTPSWFFTKDNYSGSGVTTSDVMDARLEFYVRTVMNHVMDKEEELTGKAGSLVYAWDVTNEYIHRTNEPTEQSWMDVYGNMKLQPSYVKKAFTLAYEELEKRGLQDQVTLFYNDYNEYDCADDIVELVKFINSDKKVCGGIGMQSHLTGPDNPTIDLYAEALDKFLATGLEIQVTELDAEVDSNDLEDQAAYMKSIMETIVTKQLNRDKNVNPKGITGVTIWGLYDTCSWRSNIPLLFASGINDPKPSFYAFLEAAKAK